LLKAKRSLGKMRQPVYHGRYQFTWQTDLSRRRQWKTTSMIYTILGATLLI